MSTMRVLSLAMTSAALLAPPADAARLVPLTRIDNPQAIADPTAAVDARFGAAVAVAGNVLLVGVPRHDAGGLDDRGQVRVFQRVGDVWNPVASIEGASAGANFGASLAVSGDIVVVGAPGANQARVYRLTGTTLTEVTSFAGGVGVNAIGLAVAAAPGVVFAGGADALVYRTGSGTTWSAQFTIGPSDPARVAFGASLAASGGQLLVGDPGQTGGFGAVYIGAESSGSWGVTNKLSVPGAIGFGAAVALRTPTTAIIGAPGTPFGPSSAVGNVRVWSTTGSGTELQSLVPVPPITGENFGAALAAAGATVLVGAPAETASGSEAGAVYAYRCQAAGFNPCAFGQRVQAAGGAPGDRFGAALAIDGDLVAIGAPRFDPAGSNDAGSVFLYAIDAESVFADGFEAAPP
jgi:hypothetical protein